jgi:hypothetical protein
VSRLLAATVLLAVVLAGCGGKDEPKPTGTARAAVLRFIDDLQAGRYAQVCAEAAPEVIEDIRGEALGTVEVPGKTPVERRRRRNAINAKAQSCVGAVRLYLSLLDDRLLPTVRHTALTAPEEVHGDDLRSVGDGWVVGAHDGRWQILNYDSIPTEQEQLGD